ncbi:MAG: PQQ-dependent sugar dehydrogenase [Verrucomicrobia bacterium]|nr:PQQ-dependent sugar dehydrogenase [Verrucomicrobiota bacterium]
MTRKSFRSRILAPLFASAFAIALFTQNGTRAADAETRIGLKLLAEGFTAPTVLTSLVDGSGRLLLADQAGVIYVLNEAGERSEEPFLDLRSRVCKFNAGMDERGVLGLALHPQFRENRKMYVVYSAPLRADGPADWNHTMRLSEFHVSNTDAAIAIPDSERILLQIDEPDWNHNSGRIAFGPDGLLYLSAGDGGAPNDVGSRGHAPEGNGQNLETLLGKILRIDVNRGSPYGIPADNPYADGKKGRPEIYAYGLRNPWGLSFDRGGSHDLIVTDVGQDRWEEINIVVNGGNYGWRVREGFDGFDHKNPRQAPSEAPPKTGADGKPFIDPVLVYKTLRRNFRDPDAFGVTITGGYVYRGKAFPHLVGKYIFGDWSRSMGLGDGILLAATRSETSIAGQTWTVEPLALTDHPDGRIKAFVWAIGEDADGEIYIMTNGANLVSGTRGKLYKLAPM